MKYFGGCDVGSTYTKAVILDENGKMVADTTIKRRSLVLFIRMDRFSIQNNYFFGIYANECL